MAKITEPMTMITDYILGALCILFAVLMYMDAEGDLSRISWASAFLATAIGAVGGGSSHGFKEFLSERGNLLLWRLSLVMIGVAAFFMVAGSVLSSLSWQYREFVIWFFLLVTIYYIYWISFVNDSFTYVIMDYIPAMIVVVILQVIGIAMETDSGSAPLVIAGVLVSFLAAGIQIGLRGKMPVYFNHNDLFHVIQMIGVWLLYLGVVSVKTL